MIAKSILYLPYLTVVIPLPYLLYFAVYRGNERVLLSLWFYFMILALFLRSRMIFCTLVGVFLGQLMVTPIRFNLTDEIKSLILWPALGVVAGFAADWMKRTDP